MILQQALLTQLRVDLVVIRRANAGVADALDSAFHSDLAFRACDEVVEAINDKRKQSSYPECADADAESAACIAMHQVANQESRGGTKQGRRGKRTGFNPSGFRSGMFGRHVVNLADRPRGDNHGNENF